MIPSTAPPFGMTRWSPTRQNRVSVLPYRLGDPKITGFIGTTGRRSGWATRATWPGCPGWGR
ncbi:hypothetical protein ABT299_25810 [Spirillospora sp. NPDC000708]